MPIEPITHHSWLFVPPLDLPLTLRAANGRFGAFRPTPLAVPPPCTTSQTIPADDPRNPTGADVHYANGIHEAVDLAAAAGACVYAAYSGRVVDVEVAGIRGNVTIDHHPEGLGFLTKYNHITDVRVAEGDFIGKGMPFAAVSSEPDEPHLHFELWSVLDRDTAAPGWPGDSDLVPVDPTRALYEWERQTGTDEALADGPVAPQTVGLVLLNAIPFLRVAFEAATVHVPLYEPMTTDERLAVDLLRDAGRRGADVTVRYRSSSFWGVDVVTQVELGMPARR